MRIRQVRPEFWKDDVMADLAPEVRLFYIGLWCVADDAGWIEWNTATVAADLFPYANRRVREGHVVKWADELTRVGRIVRHDCGCVCIPRLPEHQKNGGKTITTAYDRHVSAHGTDQSVPVHIDTERSARANNANATSTPNGSKGGVGGNGLPHVTPAVAAAWEEASGLTFLASGQFAMGYLDDACRRHPESAVAGAILEARRGFNVIPSSQQLAAAVRALLDPFKDPKAAKADDDAERERAASRRRVEATLRQTHGLGAHTKSRHPQCPLCREDAA